MHHPIITEAERLQWLRLARSENVGSKTFFTLMQLYGTVEDALERVQEMSLKGGRKKAIRLCSKAEAEREMEAAESLGAQVLVAHEAAFPTRLKHTKDCPPLITVRGNVDLLSCDAIGIVGARNASANGCRFAEKMAQDLGFAQFVCVSGLARGIDTAVHRGSIETGTVAVIAGGIDNIYPKENAHLYHEIAEKGAIVAEHPYGAQPRSQHFPQRNRIISGLSYGTVVVEAALQSGSLITARMALEQGREVFAVPGSPLDPRCKGTNELIRQGATLTESAQDVIVHISTMRQSRIKHMHDAESTDFAGTTRRTVDEQLVNHSRDAILSMLSSSPVEIDTLIAQSQLPAQVVLTVLLELELAGRLERHRGNQVALVYGMDALLVG